MTSLTESPPEGREGTRLPVAVYLLMIAQALAGAIPPIMVSLGGIVAQTMQADPMLTTLPVSLFMVGTCVATVPVAMLIRRFGRRPVYLTGALVATTGGILCTWAVMSWSFPLFCLGALVFGLNIACVQSFRFAGGLVVPPGLRARAVSVVLMGGLGSAILGPQLVIHSGAVNLGIPYASAFLGQAALAMATLPVLAFLRMPAVQAVPQPATPAAPRAGRVPITRDYLLAVLCGAVAYGSMSFTMTAAPLAMVACGLGTDNAALGIQWHILGMFAPSLITGRLIDRFGHLRVMLSGIGLIAAGACIALSGEALGHFWATLALLGIGWNFAYTGSTVMIARASASAVTLQGMADFLIFAFVATASLFAGGLLHVLDWAALNLLVLGVLALVLVLVALNLRRGAAARQRS